MLDCYARVLGQRNEVGKKRISNAEFLVFGNLKGLHRVDRGGQCCTKWSSF